MKTPALDGSRSSSSSQLAHRKGELKPLSKSLTCLTPGERLTHSKGTAPSIQPHTTSTVCLRIPNSFINFGGKDLLSLPDHALMETLIKDLYANAGRGAGRRN
ncbi:hypothetical protein FKM82_030184 [Ascaphus truei]